MDNKKKNGVGNMYHGNEIDDHVGFNRITWYGYIFRLKPPLIPIAKCSKHIEW